MTLEARFRSIVEEQAELVSLATAEGTLVYVNPAYARHFGCQPQAMVGTSLFGYIVEQDREAVRSYLAEVMRTGIAGSGENRMVAADGKPLWVAWTNSVQYEAGQALLLSVGRDITQRKHAESALAASMAMLERTGQVARVGGWELDLRSGHLIWTEQTRRIHEVPSDFQPTLESALAFYTPEAQQAMDAAVKRGMQAGIGWDLELALTTARGRHIWVRAVGEVEVDAQGRARRLVGALQDVTERHELERQLAENERFLRQLADNLPVRVAYLDRQRRYRFVNQKMLRYFGRERDEVIGHTRAELLPEVDDSAMAGRARAALAGQALRFEFEETVDGRRRRVENRLTPHRNDAGEVCGFFVAGIDITDRSNAEKAVRDLAAIFANTTDCVVQTNAHGRVRYMNPAVRRVLGFNPDEPVTRRRFTEFIPRATRPQYTRDILPTVRRDGVWVGETTIYRSGRVELPVSQMVIAHRGADGRIERFSAVMRDISAAVAARSEILRQSATLRSVTNAIPATVAVVGRDGRYRFVNRAFEQWIGLSSERILGRSSRDVLGEAEFQRRWPWIQRALTGETVTFELAYPGDPDETHLAISYIPLQLESRGPLDGFIAVAQDISMHKREASRLTQLAERDPLTQVLNRAGFEQTFERMRQQAGSGGLALLYIDLDHFKPVNDRHGHPVGDQVLQTFAQRLIGLVRPTDAVARLGGDEFAVLLQGIREARHAECVAAKILAVARAPFEIGDRVLHIGASIGVAFSAEPLRDGHELVARADAGLLRAKAGGRGRQHRGTV